VAQEARKSEVATRKRAERGKRMTVEVEGKLRPVPRGCKCFAGRRDRAIQLRKLNIATGGTRR
jgi:hypothetical protein